MDVSNSQVSHDGTEWNQQKMGITLWFIKLSLFNYFDLNWPNLIRIILVVIVNQENIEIESWISWINRSNLYYSLLARLDL